MWPFKKKTPLPGFSKDSAGRLVFELTEEEQIEVQKQFDMFRRPGEVFVVKSEIKEDLEREVTAQGLFFYSDYQARSADFDSNKNGREEILKKALASMAKACSFSQIPIYKYYLACYLEMNARPVEAKTLFRDFMVAQKNFKPTLIEGIVLNTLPVDVESALNSAAEKCKG